MSNVDAPKRGRLALGVLGTFDSLNPFIIRGVAPSGLREYVFESLMTRSGDEPFSLYGLIAEAVEMPPDRAWITFHLRREARFADGHPITSRGRAVQPRGSARQRLALSPLALRQGGQGREGGRAQRALHLRSGRRPRGAAAHRPDADPACPPHHSRDLRAHDPGAPARQRPLRDRARGCRPLHHLSPQSRLVGARSADQPRALQLRGDPHRVFPRRRRHVRGFQSRRDRPAAGGRSRPLGRGLHTSRRRRTDASSSARWRRSCRQECRRWCSTRDVRRFRTSACVVLSS